MKKTKDNWIKAFREKFRYWDLTAIDDLKEVESFISQVEKDAYQLGLRDGIKKEHEKSESWTELNKQGVINTHKLIKDAIEKTNKRWREKIEGQMIRHKDGRLADVTQGHNKLLSDLLEDTDNGK